MDKRSDVTGGSWPYYILGRRTLLVAKGIATRSEQGRYLAHNFL